MFDNDIMLHNKLNVKFELYFTFTSIFIRRIMLYLKNLVLNNGTKRYLSIDKEIFSVEIF